MTKEGAQKQIVERLGPGMASMGFTLERGIFRRTLNPKVYGEISFGIVVRAAAIQIEPYVRVCFEEIEADIRRMYDFVDESYRGTTISIPLRYTGMLSSKRVPHIRFFEDESDRETARRIVEDINNFGMQFFSEWRDLELLIVGLKKLREGGQGAVICDVGTVLPVALFHAGRSQEGKEFLDRALAELPNIKNQGYVLTYRKFANAYLRLIRGDPPE